MVAKDSVLADCIGWVDIGIVSSRISTTFMINFGIPSKIEGFIDLLRIGGICSVFQRVVS